MRIDPKLIIKKLIENYGKIRKTARDLCISPSTVNNWRIRSKTGSYGKIKFRNLVRKSTKPKNISGSTSMKTFEQDSVSLLRKNTGYCAKKLNSILKFPYHHSTIHRFLKKKGLINSSGYHRRPLYQDTIHMHVKNVKTLGKLQMDVKYVTPELSGLEHTCYLYAVIDILSRYKQGIIFPLLDQEYSIRALEYILTVLPLKADFVQTDNGLEFQKRFIKFLKEKHNFKHHYIHKSNPNENAVIERSFRTDQEEFFFFRLRRKNRPESIDQLNILYHEYLKEYNEIRPHLSLNCQTPPQKIKSVQ